MNADARQAILDLGEYSYRLAPGDGEKIRQLCKVLTAALKEDVCRCDPMGPKHYPKPFCGECGKSVKVT